MPAQKSSLSRVSAMPPLRVPASERRLLSSHITDRLNGSSWMACVTRTPSRASRPRCASRSTFPGTVETTMSKPLARSMYLASIQLALRRFAKE
jgi:hypothetical protein